MKKDLLIQIGISIIVVCILILITLLVLAQFSPINICEQYCEQNNGKFWIASDCTSDDILECSGWCNFPDNKMLYCRDILKNITNLRG